MADPNETQPGNYGDLNIGNGSVGLDGDAAGVAMSADLSDDSSGEAEMKALDEEGEGTSVKSIDEGDPRTTSDGSGTSETD
jgi:hypothetical protein